MFKLQLEQHFTFSLSKKKLCNVCNQLPAMLLSGGIKLLGLLFWIVLKLDSVQNKNVWVRWKLNTPGAMLVLPPAWAADVAHIRCEQRFQQCLISSSVTSCHVKQHDKLAVKCTCSCPSHVHYIKPGTNLWSYLRVVCLTIHPSGCFVVCLF